MPAISADRYVSRDLGKFHHELVSETFPNREASRCLAEEAESLAFLPRPATIGDLQPSLLVFHVHHASSEKCEVRGLCINNSALG
jgi:hypothetical protein